jgi:hypothetical protein
MNFNLDVVTEKLRALESKKIESAAWWNILLCAEKNETGWAAIRRAEVPTKIKINLMWVPQVETV